MASGVITKQPMTKKAEVMSFVRDLDPTQVSGMIDCSLSGDPPHFNYCFIYYIYI